MHDPTTAPPSTATQSAPSVRDIDAQIAEQDRAIVVLRQRVAIAAVRRPRFSFRALDNELELEGELSAARERRGALLYDRLAAETRH
jgi:hypothetical protein